MNDNVSILVINDNIAIVEGLESKIITPTKGYTIKKYIIDTKKELEVITTEISKVIKKYKVTHIISDRDFAQIKIKGDLITKKDNYINIDNIILGVIKGLDELCLRNIKSFIFYTYDPFSISIRKDLKELRLNISGEFLKKIRGDKKSIYNRIKTIETSSVFRRPGKTGIYPNGFNKTNCDVGSIESCKFYGEFLADVLLDAINYDEKLVNYPSPYLYYKTQNHELSKFIRSFEDPAPLKTFKIGSVSCYGNVYNKEKYSVYAPFRTYYEKINDYIFDKGLNRIFYDKSSDNIDYVKTQWVYFKYEVYRDDQLYLVQSELKEDLENGIDIIKKWLPLLHATIYYCKGDVWWNVLLEARPRKDPPISTVTIFFAISNIQEENFKGSFNFTLFSEDNNSDVKEIETLAFEKYAHILESKLFEQILPYKNSEVKRQAAKAAISQVMSRNLSHNLGSHVLANLTSPEALLKMAEDNSHLDASGKEKKRTYIDRETDPVRKININSNAKSFNVAIGELNSYLRTRMDFLADISTGSSVIETTKDFRMDVIVPFNDRNYLLKQFIAGNKIPVELTNPDGSLYTAFPNDNLGVQALYVIMENVIRNSAKHGKGDSVNICWKDDVNKHNDLVELIIYDTNDVKEEEPLQELVLNQQFRIDLPILNKDTLRQGSWGMLEMKVAAAYLRKVPVETIEDKHEPSLLTAVKVDDGYGKYLGYRFYLQKPKNVLVILSEIPGKIHEIENIKDDYLKHGIEFISLNNLNETEISFSHELVLLVDIGDSKLNKTRKRFSKRIISQRLAELKTKLLENKEQDFIEWSWSLWYKRVIADTDSIVIEFLDDDSSISKHITLNNSSGNVHRSALLVYHCNSFRNESDYFEPFGYLHPALTWFNKFNNDTEVKPSELKCRFVEMINYSIAIVDERIQSHSQMNYDGGIVNCDKKLNDFLSKCGISVPDSSVDLNTKNFTPKLREKLNQWIESRSQNHDFLVIHLGVIEKLLGLENKNDDEKRIEIENYLLKLRTIDSRKATLIITSGRGQPETLPKGERFVHYSNIAQYIIEKRSKFHLTQLLMSARETK